MPRVHPLVECVNCRLPRLVRPGVCYSCSALFGLKPRVLVEASSGNQPPSPVIDPDRARRIAEYARRAKAKRPLFDDAECDQRRSA